MKGNNRLYGPYTSKPVCQYRDSGTSWGVQIHVRVHRRVVPFGKVMLIEESLYSRRSWASLQKKLDFLLEFS